ncbi:hypothetical protein N7454_008881 [Penicillium verhagenii]|nr:hypothetical protein N7454_008881 [Penicillium verhagenii]
MLGLQHALAVMEDSSEFNKKNMPGINDMISACAGLVVKDNATKSLRLSHYTAHEYLTQQVKDRHNEFLVGAPIEIAKVCIKYISFDISFWPENGDYDYDGDDKLVGVEHLIDFADLNHDTARLRSLLRIELRIEFSKHNPFFDYASKNWAYHANQASLSLEEVLETLDRFLPGGTLSPAALTKEFERQHSKVLESSDQGRSFNLVHIFEILETLGECWEFKAWLIPMFHGRLDAAAFFGLTDVIKLLLLQAREGCTLNDNMTHSGTALCFAASMGHEAVVQQLLGHPNIKVNIPDIYGRTPLFHAVQQGHETIVQHLLSHPDINVNILSIDGMTPLSHAAEQGHELIVQHLLSHLDINVNIPSIGGRTPLSHAAEQGHELIVQQLLQCSQIELNTYADDGWTPLYYATWRGHEEIVQRLLTHPDIDVNASNMKGTTPLLYATFTGNSAIVQHLLSHSNIKVNIPNDHKATPLSNATKQGHEVVVQQLLKVTAVGVNIPDQYGRTPLSHASEQGHEGIVLYLLEDPHIQIGVSANDGSTPLTHAANRGNTQIAHLLLNAGIEKDVPDRVGRTALTYAAFSGHQSTVQTLLLAGVEIDVIDNASRTPLIYAAENGHHAVLDLLMAANADPNRKDAQGMTPISLAVLKGHNAVVQRLLPVRKPEDEWLLKKTLRTVWREEDSKVLVNMVIESVVDPSHGYMDDFILFLDFETFRLKTGEHPLWIAAFQGSHEMVKLLLETRDFDNGLKTKILDRALQQEDWAIAKLFLSDEKLYSDYGNQVLLAPFMLAVSAGKSDTVAFFLDCSNNMLLNGQNINGETALHHAASLGRTEIIELLLAVPGIELDMKDRNEQTPLALAAKSGHRDVVGLLLGSDGVDPNMRDRNGQVPLSQAASNGHYEVVDLLLGKQDVDRFAQDINFCTPLELAIRKKNLKVVTRLLEDTGVRDTVNSGELGDRIDRALLDTTDEILQLFLGI